MEKRERRTYGVEIIMSEKRCGKTIKIQQEYEKAKADGKNALLVDKEQLEKELLGAETPFDKLFKRLKGRNE